MVQYGTKLWVKVQLHVCLIVTKSHEILWAEPCRGDVRCEKFTLRENLTLSTIHIGPGGQSSA